ncbi:hypothetical protein [Burkholderia thailandensis]|uniref:hypothetical protein n=1 Tax=Burkholderia thailandensis TaxID=57975 RepID=UPI0003156B08|nr:hypothetical protein [Burkholderia thailandensis]MBS2131230.1 hypothetical protein [Burkholderia thailandensis]MCS3396441.1 hypothetical protein [Burkholderia thailandensis]MCS6469713.1 hypothetical protein [Burkholderia thailandensis]MCS6476460.1 hypothetical protein [Burkholderia thailandensis]MCS6495350.1 hypothetical protein [Burkholderia thailandensis]
MIRSNPFARPCAGRNDRRRRAPARRKYRAAARAADAIGVGVECRAARAPRLGNAAAAPHAEKVERIAARFFADFFSLESISTRSFIYFSGCTTIRSKSAASAMRVRRRIVVVRIHAR